LVGSHLGLEEMTLAWNKKMTLAWEKAALAWEKMALAWEEELKKNLAKEQSKNGKKKRGGRRKKC
jgi:hypothetical protein